MNKSLQILFISLLLLSCKEEGNLELELLNKEIICLNNFEYNNSKLYENHYFDDKLYDSLSRNILHFKLKNNSSKRYFLILNEDNIGSLENDYYLKITNAEKIKYEVNNLSFNFYQNDSILNGQITLLTSCGILNKCSPMVLQNSLDSIFIEKLKKRKQFNSRNISLQNKEVLEKSFVLQPGETKYFTTLINLPLRKEDYWLSHVDSLKPNLASITLINNRKHTLSLLSIDQKQNISENKYELFDGIINSNKVPVRLKKMPKLK